MKNKLIVFLLTLFLIFGISYNSLRIKAEGETSEPSTEDVIETQTNEEDAEQPAINEPTSIQKWFNDNIGWFVGIPIGTLITALIEFIYLARKTKEKVAELKQTKDFNNFAKEQLEISKEMFEKSQQILVSCQETIDVLEANIVEIDGKLTARVNDIARRFDTTDVLVKETKETFENLNGIISANKEQIEKLQEAILLVSTHTNELVANSTAEQIVKLVKGE